MAGQRNYAIDWLRGALMLLVMLGHLSGAGVNYSPFKWTLYGFHMPMFMALSGYMLNVEKLREGGLAALVSRYWLRMILPWAVVFVVALPMVAVVRGPMDVVHALLHPWNHLWFVPVLFVLIVVAVVVPLSRAQWALLSVPAGIGLWLAAVVFAMPYADWPIDIRYGTMAPFFFFGLWLRSSSLRIGSWIVAPFLIGLAGYGLCFSAQSSRTLILFYPLLTLSSCLMIRWIETLPLREGLISLMGAQSLFFYLHHPWLFNIARRTLYRWMDLNLAYGVTLVLSIAVLCAAMPLLRRGRWVALLAGVV